MDRRTTLAMAGAALLAPAAALAEAAPNIQPDREMLVPVPGGRVYVRINGDLAAPKPPVVMIHGGPGGSHGSFLPALPLAADRAVILYDQLDCGLSEKPGAPANWHIPRFVDELDAIRVALGVSRWHVLGHSWGGTIALEYAARHPRELASLILQGPLISTRAWMDDAAVLRAKLPSDMQAALDACEGPTPPAKAECDAAVDAFYARFWRLRPLPAWATAYEQKHGLKLAVNIYNAMWGPNEFRATGSLANYDGEPLLKRIAAPTLFLIGDSDEVTPETARRFTSETPGARLAILGDAAHRAQSDQPGAYVATLAEWLAKQDQP
ncbi:proline iminopeptidase-family hydrolase [Sphingomonas sp. KC8]|uniref:proline iminopeptidase-family hydrolase n=1 Tax=Sphingomonas sp. KC8 TaxID=1030157 RepID=UPI0002488A4A|nr:proline iminopeptidase-family hydrolase [Sphingomonas sp. KC8]ARS25732.1 putative S33 family peptidase [Sphingomonas sp. KC8]